MKMNVLFVDDEPRVLDGIKRMLRSMRSEWNIRFASGAEEALKILQEHKTDIIVSDMRMPDVDGAELLTQVREQFPDIARLILSGYAEEELTLKAVNVAHQYLAKPCDPEILISTIQNTLCVREALHSERLRTLIMRLDTIPSPPQIYQKLMAQLNEPDHSIDEIAKTIDKDPAMTAKILKLVNSSFFGIVREVSDTGTATSMLGLELTRSLVLSIHIFSRFEEIPPELSGLWQHSLRVGLLAKQIAVLLEQPKCMSDIAFTSGVLHDIGKLILANGLGDDYQAIIREAAESGVDLTDIENEKLGANHAEVGAYLLDLWGLPDSIIGAVMFHHSPLSATNGSPNVLTSLHIADVMDHGQLIGEVSKSNATVLAMPEFDIDYLKSVNLHERIEELIAGIQANETRLAS